MKSEPVPLDDNLVQFDSSGKTFAPLARRIGARVLHEAREALPPIFFLVGFNFIVFTTNLLLAHYADAPIQEPRSR